MEQAFIQRLMGDAKAAGIEAAEMYIVEKESFSAIRNNGEIIDYKSNVTRGLGFRGLVNGRMGYASTEAFDGEAVGQLIRGVKESAALCEDTDESELFPGGDAVPTIQLYDPALDRVAPEAKLRLAETLEKSVKAEDARVENGYNAVETGKHTVRIVNSLGLDRSFTENMCALFAEPNVREDGCVSTGAYQQMERRFEALDAAAVAKESVWRAVSGLHAKAVPSGKYRVVLHHEVMASLLGAFATIFSGETAQKGLSLLADKLGQAVAAPCVMLTDDPLRTDAMNSRPFDAEGVASSRHVLIEGGVFKTFLYDLKTARKAGVKTTANAGKAGYAASIHVMPSNLLFEKGDCSFAELLKTMGDGLVITEVMGLHAGANAVSGEFSLLSKGYRVKAGQRAEPVEQITVAGNFYDLLRDVRAFADDLRFPDGAIGSPSAYVGELSVSGS